MCIRDSPYGNRNTPVSDTGIRSPPARSLPASPQSDDGRYLPPFDDPPMPGAMAFRSACIAAARPPRPGPGFPPAADHAPCVRAGRPVCARFSSAASSEGVECLLSRPTKGAWRSWWSSACAPPVGAPNRRSAYLCRQWLCPCRRVLAGTPPVSYTHLRAHETVLDLVCRLLLE